MRQPRPSKSRRTPDEWHEGEHLLSLEEADLPAGRHAFHKEELMTFIQQETQGASATTPAPPVPAPARRRVLRPLSVLPAAACSLAVLAAGVLTLTGKGGTGDEAVAGPPLTATVGTGTSSGVTQLLDRISLASNKAPQVKVGAGQYVYVESRVGTTYEKTVDNKTTLASDGIHRRQIWNSTDGTEGWLIDPAVTPPGGEKLDRTNENGTNEPAYLNAPTYDYLATLPTDPETLLKEIYKETKGKGNNPDQEAFTTIGDLLNESLPPAELNTALFKAVGQIPGVVQVKNAVDAVGRQGIAVARLDETSGARTEWVFDPKTYAYLGERTIQVRPNGGDSGLIEPGTVLYTEAVIVRQAVHALKEVPSSGV
ncbi:CU044_5270 family protein [Streptomyces sp. SKN60]|uniref:CU044_5270 family protein n=1 Tax=Streptomyces sp. SKN60 TaxID=2855506 RepID=UPI0022473D78|nr:CU044_5270 family protein [Streptomyces sp. SKN60]MCX2181977.1 CU044_5270 family protein [Streptomyces sp. SKN60]